jgi:hypothetical protein
MNRTGLPATNLASLPFPARTAVRITIWKQGTKLCPLHGFPLFWRGGPSHLIGHAGPFVIWSPCLHVWIASFLNSHLLCALFLCPSLNFIHCHTTLKAHLVIPEKGGGVVHVEIDIYAYNLSHLHSFQSHLTCKTLYNTLGMFLFTKPYMLVRKEDQWGKKEG